MQQVSEQSKNEMLPMFKPAGDGQVLRRPPNAGDLSKGEMCARGVRRTRVVMGEIFIIHAADARGLACRAASQLAAEGHSVRRRETGAPAGDDGVAADAVLVIWSPDFAAGDPLIDAARRALARRMLVPIAVGAAEPPPAFAHLWPIDLSGWDGDGDDPRWQFVRDEIALARMRHEAASPSARQKPGPPAAGTRRAPKRPARPMLLTRMIPPAMAGLAVLSATAVLMATPQDPLSGGRKAGAPMRFAEPAEPGPRPEEAQEAAPTAEITLRWPDEGLASVRPAPDDEASQVAQPSLPVDLVAQLLEEDAPSPAPDEAVEEAPAGVPEEAALQPAADSQTEIIPANEAALETAASEAPAGDAGAESEPLSLPPPAADDFAGVVFRDCLACPDMAEIPAGMFEMGEDGAGEAEGPARIVMIARPFALSRREITFKDWQACVAGGGCRAYTPPDAGWGRGDRPVINVSWEDAQSYVAWLSATTGRRYRLPSEAEWEYAARAGGAAPPAEAGGLTASLANYEDGAQGRTIPAASFAPSIFGLYDMLGNVWEWVADCWQETHAGAPTDGAAVASECQARTLKGGAYDSSAWRLRPAHRIAKTQSAREPDNGFRVARDLP